MTVKRLPTYIYLHKNKMIEVCKYKYIYNEMPQSAAEIKMATQLGTQIN